MEDTSSSTDVNSSSSHRQQFTARDLQHVLYDRNPVKLVHVYDNVNESEVDCSGEKQSVTITKLYLSYTNFSRLLFKIKEGIKCGSH